MRSPDLEREAKDISRRTEVRTIDDGVVFESVAELFNELAAQTWTVNTETTGKSPIAHPCLGNLQLEFKTYSSQRSFLVDHDFFVPGYWIGEFEGGPDYIAHLRDGFYFDAWHLLVDDSDDEQYLALLDTQGNKYLKLPLDPNHAMTEHYKFTVRFD